MKNKKNSNFSTTIQEPTICPYCGSHVVFRSANGIYKENKNNTMLYVCSNYPNCDSYVRVHRGTKIPVGVMANQRLRSMHLATHKVFDQLYLSGAMTRREAYEWLAFILQKPLAYAHIGYLQDYQCQFIINESKKFLKRRNKVIKFSSIIDKFGGEQYVATE